MSSMLRFCVAVSIALCVVIAVAREPATRIPIKPRPDPATFDNKRTFEEVGGAGGKAFQVVIYWNNLKSVPGSHEIVATIRCYGKDGLAKNGVAHWFESGNRRELVGVERGANDQLVLRFISHGGEQTVRVAEVSYVVSEKGLRGPSTQINRVLDIEGVYPLESLDSVQEK